MFERLKELSEALKTFGKDDEVEVVDKKTSIEKLDDFNQAKDVFSSTQSEQSKDVESTDDTSEVESVKDILIKDEKKQKSEDSLEKKLKNIEKVIETFSGGDTETIPTKDMYATSSENINPKALDMGSVQAKNLMTEYLKPSVNSDRVGLLYENLRKLNLI